MTAFEDHQLMTGNICVCARVSVKHVNALDIFLILTTSVTARDYFDDYFSITKRTNDYLMGTCPMSKFFI